MKVITVCGSMRFSKEIMEIATKLETDNDFCVLQPVYEIDGKALTESELKKVADAHYKKIDISDAIYVVNIGGYIDKSVLEEITYAKASGKEVLYFEDK